MWPGRFLSLFLPIRSSREFKSLLVIIGREQEPRGSSVRQGSQLLHKITKGTKQIKLTFSASAAWARRHWQVACTTSSVTKEKGSLLKIRHKELCCKSFKLNTWRCNQSLRASSPFWKVARSHATVTRHRRRDTRLRVDFQCRVI